MAGDESMARDVRWWLRRKNTDNILERGSQELVAKQGRTALIAATRTGGEIKFSYKIRDFDCFQPRRVTLRHFRRVANELTPLD